MTTAKIVKKLITKKKVKGWKDVQRNDKSLWITEKNGKTCLTLTSFTEKSMSLWVPHKENIVIDVHKGAKVEVRYI